MSTLKPMNSLARKHFNEHKTLPPEFELVKQRLIDIADERQAKKLAQRQKEQS